MNKLAEQQTEWIISNILVNNDWVIDNKPEKNVFSKKQNPTINQNLK